MVWPFSSGDSSSAADATPSDPLQQHSTGFGGMEAQPHSSGDDAGLFGGPVLALDQLKHAGVPLKMQMSPYLQMDPSIFKNSQPQYILPEGAEPGTGKRLEHYLGQIGWGVGGGFAVGSVRGFFPELFNPETRQLKFKPALTRLTNATMKGGSAYAQVAGSAVFMYSVVQWGLTWVRADDDLNSLLAGPIAGAIYRSGHGLRGVGVGAGLGLLLASAWVVGNPDSRQHLREMFPALSA